MLEEYLRDPNIEQTPETFMGKFEEIASQFRPTEQHDRAAFDRYLGQWPIWVAEDHDIMDNFAPAELILDWECRSAKECSPTHTDRHVAVKS